MLALLHCQRKSVVEKKGARNPTDQIINCGRVLELGMAPEFLETFCEGPFLDGREAEGSGYGTTYGLAVQFMRLPND